MHLDIDVDETVFRPNLYDAGSPTALPGVTRTSSTLSLTMMGVTILGPLPVPRRGSEQAIVDQHVALDLANAAVLRI